MSAPPSSSRPDLQWITLGGGCFWCTDAVFSRLDGVDAVECGYANGQVAQPSYEQVCTGRTGHAEVVKVGFNPSRISFGSLLKVFFATHDPTTLNRQGADVGTQYRSGIYTYDEEQARVAREVIEELTRDGVFPAPIVTEVQPLANYWPAEPEHQRYYERHPHQGYCAYVIAPKVAKLRQQYARLLRPSA